MRELTKATMAQVMKKFTTVSALAKYFGCEEETIESMLKAMESEYNVAVELDGDVLRYRVEYTVNPIERESVSIPFTPHKRIRLGIVADTHIGSKWTQLTALNTMYDIFALKGVHTVLHAGDIDEGVKMREGHEYECYIDGADNHLDELIRHYPRRKGITTMFITGNHDHSLIKRAGYDIGKGLARVRKDLIYLGPNEADVTIGKTVIRVMHPTKSNFGASISLAPQQIIESFSSGDKPNILIVGHYHKSLYFVHRNVHCIMPGCFQAQTPFLRNKGVQVSIGGWIVDLTVDEEGHIVSIQSEYFPCYVPDKDDYKNYER